SRFWSIVRFGQRIAPGRASTTADMRYSQITYSLFVLDSGAILRYTAQMRKGKNRAGRVRCFHPANNSENSARLTGPFRRGEAGRDRSRSKTMRTGTLLFAMLLWLAAAAPPAAAAVFKWANDGDVRALDPYTFNETVQNSFLANIYERLIQHGKDLSLQPVLAVSWEKPRPNNLRFHLPPNAQLHDRRAFTAPSRGF